MKLTINQSLDQEETEIIINYSVIDQRLQHLIDYIRQYSFSIQGILDNSVFQIPLEKIMYIDTADKKTFLYCTQKVYQAKETLSTLEKVLLKTPFVRISKSCIANSTYLKCVKPIANHHLEAMLKNGEKLIVSRSYIKDLKEKLKN
ncbi:LytTR family transcriptional regulator DNA-binding domain-containing protein [Mobilitalea sibirica]|uniref:LytTR family transcriptional regulator DNA-binding domain-containing protein n=1 Tax=Mobilitalea sibirica TaxID=1462919 RepID=A0A8J7H8Y2_9FIRM|nr:LytTR family DNA-binding domain-containing protein [Mobilitalea sibirica]MBH1941731.1 LytTR family transcriptional regulator DNA-binding domain-containing protein [Mobilitalea sibirica]